jgi:hypothetical protein
VIPLAAFPLAVLLALAGPARGDDGRFTSALVVEAGRGILREAGAEACGGMRDRLASWLDAYGGAVTVSLHAPDRSAGLAWELGWRASPHAGLAARGGMVVPPDARIVARANGAFGEILAADDTVSCAAFPVLAGGWMEWKARWGLRVRGELLGGPVFVSATRRGSWTFKDPANDEEAEYYHSVSAYGMGRMVEAWLEAGYDVAQGVTAFLGAGWRQGVASRTRYTGDYDADGDGIPELGKGTVARKRTGGPLSLDAEGPVLGAGVRISLGGKVD